MRGLFARSRAPGRATQVKAWVAARLGLCEADLVTLAELVCRDPGCPPVETVVSVHRSGGARRDWRIPKPLAEIAEADILAAMAGGEPSG
ncbi:MAG: hypothetical protein ACFCUS_13225 [Rubrimonas sp.]